METVWRSRAWTAMMLLGLACGGAGSSEARAPDVPSREATTGGEDLRLVDREGREARVVRRSADVPGAPARGEFQIHLIDVGTGLAVLVRGHDFIFLFDGGSNDDDRTGPNNRLLAYLSAALGVSPLENCSPAGEASRRANAGTVPHIDVVMLSHPHRDHVVLLPDVLRCYSVGAVYDVGVVNDAVFYADFVRAVANEPDVTYNTVVEPSPTSTIAIDGDLIDLAGVARRAFGEGDEIPLGEDADLTVLAADGVKHANLNRNSLVVVLMLGDSSVLLTGDAGSGPRPQPGDALTLGGVEAKLVRDYAEEINVDVLQVGHHGSATSSGPAFVAAVSPTWALIGAGPLKYGGHKRPDPRVEAMLETVVEARGGHVLNTDDDDGNCPVSDRVGVDDPGYPGGCGSYVLFLR